jgi:Tfp pilus assembly protein PilF
VKKTFTTGLVLSALVMLPIAAGSTYWVMKKSQQARANVLLIEAHRFMEKNESNLALAKLNQSVGADPYRDLTHLALAELYEQAGDRVLALEEFEITKVLCEGCYKVDEKINRLQAKTKDQKPKHKP